MGNNFQPFMNGQPLTSDQVQKQMQSLKGDPNGFLDFWGMGLNDAFQGLFRGTQNSPQSVKDWDASHPYPLGQPPPPTGGGVGMPAPQVTGPSTLTVPPPPTNQTPVIPLTQGAPSPMTTPMTTPPPVPQTGNMNAPGGANSGGNYMSQNYSGIGTGQPVSAAPAQVTAPATPAAHKSGGTIHPDVLAMLMHHYANRRRHG
jgi:hypothetical protein